MPVTKLAWDYNDPLTQGQVKQFDVWTTTPDGTTRIAKVATTTTVPTDAAPLSIPHNYGQTYLEVVAVDLTGNDGEPANIGIGTQLPNVTNLRVVG